MTTHPATLIFLHIPKTAGTSLRLTIAKQYPAAATYQYYQSDNRPPLEDLPATQRAAIRLMSSHEPFGTHDQYLTPPVHYLTMLREPMERLISEYYYHKSREPRADAIRHQNLLKYAERSHKGYRDNLQVRLLSGQGDTGVVTGSTLAKAKANLTAPSMTFGLVERYAESLLLMSREFGWQDIRLTRKNATPRPAAEAIDEQTRQALLQHNEYDLALYVEAAALLDRRLVNAGINAGHVSKLYLSGWTDKTENFTQRMGRVARRVVKKSRRFVFSNLRKILRRIRQAI